MQCEEARVKPRPTKAQIMFAILLAVNLIATGVLLAFVLQEKAVVKERFALYIGTNDRDTDQLEIPFDKWHSIVKSTCAQYVSGCTIIDGSGVWTSDAGALVQESSLICVIYDATEDAVEAIARRLLTELNQESLLIERQNVRYTYLNR